MASDSFDLDRIGGWRGLDALIDEVLAAGEDALRLQRTARVETKSDRSPVTEADREVEARLRAFLSKHWPDVGFLGEESGGEDGTTDARFIVDPIDGTRAFIRGLDTWSILVGLEADDQPSVGVAFMPAAGDLFVGVRGAGAKANGRPCHVSTTSKLEEALVGTGGGRQFVDAGEGPMLLDVIAASFTHRAFADFANYRALLAGRMDAVVDPGVAPWDICAAAVLVREAGGTFTDLDGASTIHGRGGLASNGPIHDALTALTRGEGTA